MDLKLISVFLTVHKYKSYTEAAHVLEVSLPAISKAIKKLENQLNMQLFVKSGRNMTCTKVGEQLALECNRGMYIINNAISTSNHFVVYCPEDLIQITRELPDTTFLLPPNEQERLLVDLRLQKVDLAIDAVTTDDKSFICEPITREKLNVICRVDHPRLSGTNITPSQFSAENHIAYKRKFNGQSIFDNLVDSQNQSTLSRNVAMEVSSSHSICMIIAQTDYIGIVRESISKKWAEKLELNVMALPDNIEIEVQLNLIYHQRFKNDQNHQKMRELIKRNIQKFCQ